MTYITNLLMSSWLCKVVSKCHRNYTMIVELNKLPTWKPHGNT